MRSAVTVTGLDELKRKLQRMSDGLSGSQLAAAAHVGALEVEYLAKAKAPVLTGNLRRSIHTGSTVSGHRATATVGTDVVYAPAQEFGTSRGVPAHPYMRPAIDEGKGSVEKAVGIALVSILRKALG